MLLLSQEGQRLRSDQHLWPHQLRAWPWLPEAAASANLNVLKKHWLFVCNEGKLIQKELPKKKKSFHFLLYKKARAILCVLELWGESLSVHQHQTPCLVKALQLHLCGGLVNATARPSRSKVQFQTSQGY